MVKKRPITFKDLEDSILDFFYCYSEDDECDVVKVIFRAGDELYKWLEDSIK